MKVVVIGAGQGGLSAAVHARLKGHEVVVLERSSQVGGKAAPVGEQGFRLDPGPSIIILPRLYEAVFKRAGKRIEDYLQFLRLDPISQVRFGEEVFDLPADRLACEELVAKRWPEDGAAFKGLLQKLDRVVGHIDKSVFHHPFLHPWQLANPHLIATAIPFDVRKTYKEMVDGWFQSPLLRAFFYGFPSYGGQTYDSKAPGALMIPYLMLQEGVWYPVGGVAAIPAAFHRLAVELGVQFQMEANVERLEATDTRLTSIVLDTGERISADAVISNVDRFTTGTWLGKSFDAAPSLSYYTLQWGLKTRPEGLAHHTLLVPEQFEKGFEQLYRDRRFPTPPIVYLNETAKIDPSCAPEGAGNLFAVVTTPAIEGTFSWETQASEFEAETLQVMRGFGIDVSPDQVVFTRRQDPRYFQAAHGNYLGSLYGPDEKVRPFAGMFPLTNKDGQLSNLLYCGGSVQPGAGLPMVTLSGKFAADLL